MWTKIRIDVDDEQGADVVGDVAAAERQRPASVIRASSPARPSTAAAKASRAPSRSSASSPASVLPPGEATALRTSAGAVAAQQLGGPGRRLHHQLPRQLRVEPVRSAGIGDRLDRQRQVGRRAAHHRGRRVEVLVGQLDHVPERLQLLPQPPALGGPATQRTPLRTSTPTFGITRSTSAPGKRGRDRLQRRGRRAPRRPPSAPCSSGATSLQLRRLHRQHHQVGPLGDLARWRRPLPPSSPASACARPEPRVGEQHPANSPAQPRAIAAAMLPEPTKPTIIGGAYPARGRRLCRASARHPRPGRRTTRTG